MRLILDYSKTIYNNKKLLLFFIFLISIIFSLIFLFFFREIGPIQHRVPGADYQVYYAPLANSILEGKGIIIKGGLVPTIPPGYPVILSGIFGFSKLLGIEKLELIVIFNVIITAISCCFLFLIAESIFGKKIGLIASFLWMSYPFNLWLIKNPNTEVPFILFFYLGIWLAIFSLKRKHLGFTFLTGIILGLASLIRYISLFLPLFLVLLIIFFFRSNSKKIQFLLAAILLLGNLVVVLPWNIYLISRTNQGIPVFTFETGGFLEGFTFALSSGAGGDQVVVSSEVRALMERAKAEDLNKEVKIFRFLVKELINYPTPFLKLIGLKLARSWYSTSQMWWEREILTVQILYLLTSLIGIIYGIKIYKDRIRNIILLLGIVIYFWGITVFCLSILRFMIPVMGLVIIFSAILIESIITNTIYLAKKPQKS